MSLLEEVTPLLITHDEIANIERTLRPLQWAKRIVVIDSGSTDGTLEVLARHPQVVVFHRPFDTFADQCNFGLGKIDTEWVLSMDADYVVTDELLAELRALEPGPDQKGYRIGFQYCIHGRRLNGSLYPARTVLYRARQGHYENVGHGHRVAVDGTVSRLRGKILHDDRKPLDRWLASQVRYTQREAEYLLATPRARLSRRDRLRLWGWPAPLLVLLYVLLVKGTLFNGQPGWFYAWQRMYAEILLALALIDRRLGRDGSGKS